MKVLIIKMSSLGDIIHTLPALTDAARALDNIQFDWVVETAFQDIPRWHPKVRRVIPIALRHWRKNIKRTLKTGEFKQFIQQLRAEEYDLIIDAQGLIKSAAVAFCARGQRVGLDKKSAREPLASLLYQQTISADKEQHAVEKVRELFAKALKYPRPAYPVDYGIDISQLTTLISLPRRPYIMFLHGTTWATKHWPESYWCALAKKASQKGVQVLLTWGNELEKIRAQKIVAYCQAQRLTVIPYMLPKLSLNEITYVIANAQATVAVDTGLGHIAAMMNVPTLSLYGPTFPAFTGAYGQQQQHLTVTADCHPCFKKTCPVAEKKKQAQDLYPPCFASLTPEKIWAALEKILININGKVEGIHG